MINTIVCFISQFNGIFIHNRNFSFSVGFFSRDFHSTSILSLSTLVILLLCFLHREVLLLLYVQHFSCIDAKLKAPQYQRKLPSKKSVSSLSKLNSTRLLLQSAKVRAESLSKRTLMSLLGLTVKSTTKRSVLLPCN